MTAFQAVMLVVGSLVLVSAMSAVMLRVIRTEQRTIESRYHEWIAGGSIPEEKPNFDLGPPAN